MILRRVHLEQPRRTHATADTHRHQPQPTAALPEFVNELRRELRASGAERMTERDRAAVHIHSFGIDPEILDDRDDLRRERLIELDHLHVLQRDAGALQRLWYRFDRTDAHDIRIDTRGSEGDESREGL